MFGGQWQIVRRRGIADVGVGGHPHHGSRGLDVVDGRQQLRPIRLGHLRFRVVGGGQNALQRAVLREQRGRRLLADARHAGQPVGRIAPQQRQFGICRSGPVDRDAVLLGDLGGPVLRRLRQAATEVEHPDRHRVVANQLKQIAVAADDDDGVFALPGCQRAQHVVGLAGRRTGGGDAECVQDLHDHVDLRGEIVGHLFDVGLARRFLLGDAVRLVRRDQVNPPLRPPVVITAHHQAGGPLAGDNRGDGVEEATHGVDRTPVGRRDR